MNNDHAPRKFDPPGPLALDPAAFGMVLLLPYEARTIERDGVTVLSIRGPIAQFADEFCESYESIVARVEAAAAKSPRAIVLSIASPGGVVAGCFEAVDAIRPSPGAEPWMDLHGNLNEAALDMAGDSFTGRFALKYRGVGYGSARSDLNVTIMPGENIQRLQRPEAKAFYSGGRCMRFK